MKKNNLIFQGLIIGLILFLSVSNTFGQWPQWRGPMRDGISPENNLLKTWPTGGPKLLWKVDTIGDGFSSTAIQNNMVFTTGKRDSMEIITAFDLKGNLKWQKIVGRASKEKDWPQSRCTPTVYKNKVYAYSVYGDIACFDCETGKPEWKMTAYENFEGQGYKTSGIAESPLIVDDKLIITPAGKRTTMVALNRLTGKTIWTSESIDDTTAYTSPVLFPLKNKKVIFMSTKKYGLLVDSNTGKIIWKEKDFSGDPLIPLIYNNKVYLPGAYKKGGKFCSWDDGLTKKSVIWKDTISANPLGGAVLLNNKIIVSGNSRGLSSLDIKTGNILSHYDKIGYCTLLVADNMLYSYEDRTGKVSLLRMNGNNFELVSSFKITSGSGPRIAHMAIANGLLFIRHGKVLMAYDLKQRT